MGGEASVAVNQSYDPARLRHGFDAEVARLRRQVELSWAVEHRRLLALGVSDGQRVLEPGCGAGFVTERLAACLPCSRILAPDSDLRRTQLARRPPHAREPNQQLSLLK